MQRAASRYLSSFHRRGRPDQTTAKAPNTGLRRRQGLSSVRPKRHEGFHQTFAQGARSTVEVGSRCLLLAEDQHKRRVSTQRRSCTYTAVTGASVYLFILFTQKADCTRAACWFITSGSVPFSISHAPRPGPARNTRVASWAGWTQGVTLYGTISISTHNTTLHGARPDPPRKHTWTASWAEGSRRCRCPHFMSCGPAGPIRFRE